MLPVITMISRTKEIPVKRSKEVILSELSALEMAYDIEREMKGAPPSRTIQHNHFSRVYELEDELRRIS